MDSCDKDGLFADAFHVNAGASLNVVQVDVAKLGDQIDCIILRADLKEYESILLQSCTHTDTDKMPTCMATGKSF